MPESSSATGADSIPRRCELLAHMVAQENYIQCWCEDQYLFSCGLQCYKVYLFYLASNWNAVLF